MLDVARENSRNNANDVYRVLTLSLSSFHLLFFYAPLSCSYFLYASLYLLLSSSLPSPNSLYQTFLKANHNCSPPPSDMVLWPLQLHSISFVVAVSLLLFVVTVVDCKLNWDFLCKLDWFAVDYFVNCFKKKFQKLPD
jgi:hypothetical protein